MRIAEAKGILGVNDNTAPDEIKRAYRAACKKYHPDINPAGLELMKLVNLAYQTLMDALEKGWQFDRTEPVSGIPEKMAEIIDAISGLYGVAAEICGSWLWVSGDTRPYKDTLKELGMKFARNKAAWYWHAKGYRKRSRRVLDMDEIRAMYGSETVKTETEGLQQIAA